MPSIHRPRGWEIPEREATPEDVFFNRRKFMKALGIVGFGTIMSQFAGCLETHSEQPTGETQSKGKEPAALQLLNAPRNPAFTLDRPLTDEAVAARYNNFYEFSSGKEEVWRLVDRFETKPWQVEVTGLVKNPKIYDIDELIRTMPLEERLYRFRCVEAWAMAVPWTGFPMKVLIDHVEPLSSARYVRMVTFLRPDQAPGFKTQPWYPWPYFEGLTMEEATNPLTLLAVGIYGHELPKQHGAPVRLVVPWKYGFKSIKSIVRIEFTDTQPATFWNAVAPDEYDFRANVNPAVPHPRWSQATERIIGTGERRPTLPYNGYGEYVAHLYQG